MLAVDTDMIPLPELHRMFCTCYMKLKLLKVDQWHVTHACAMWRTRDLEYEAQNFDSASTNIDVRFDRAFMRLSRADKSDGDHERFE